MNARGAYHGMVLRQMESHGDQAKRRGLKCQPLRPPSPPLERDWERFPETILRALIP